MFCYKLLTFSLWFSFLHSSAGKESTHNVEDLGSIPGLGRSPGEGNGYPLQYSGLGVSCIVHGVAKSRTDWATLTFTSLSLSADWANILKTKENSSAGYCSEYKSSLSLVLKIPLLFSYLMGTFKKYLLYYLFYFCSFSCFQVTLVFQGIEIHYITCKWQCQDWNPKFTLSMVLQENWANINTNVSNI